MSNSSITSPITGRVGHSESSDANETSRSQDDLRSEDPTSEVVSSGDESDPQQDLPTDHEPDIDEDDAVGQTQSSSHLFVGYEVPAAIQRAENVKQDSPPEIPKRYRDILHTLCSQTSTEIAEGFTTRNLLIVWHKIRSIDVDEVDDATDLYLIALVVFVWQLTCLGIQHGFYEKSASTSTLCSAHFLSAHCIIRPFHDVTWQEFKYAIQYYEDRLNRMVDANGNWIRRNLFKDMDEVEFVLAPPDATAAHYLEALENRSLIGLVQAVWTRQKVEDPATELRQLDDKPMEKRLAMEELVVILASMNEDLLKAIIDGSLPQKAELLHTEVWNALEKIPMDEHTPSIYVNCVCDGIGLSPTPTHCQVICELMSTYIGETVEGNDLARKVDQLIYPSESWPTELADRGLRRYTEWRSYLERRKLRPSGRRTLVAYFLEQMKERITKEVKLGRAHVPLAAPVIEVGFTINPKRRLYEHRHHTNSNYIMNLTEAMFQHQYPGLFRLQQKVIYTCWRDTQPWLGEIIFAQLGQWYTKGGRGFSHYPAGYSNGGAYRALTTSQWTKLERFTARNGKVLERLENEKVLEERRDALAQAETRLLEAFGEVVEAATEILKEDVRRYRDSD